MCSNQKRPGASHIPRQIICSTRHSVACAEITPLLFRFFLGGLPWLCRAPFGPAQRTVKPQDRQACQQVPSTEAAAINAPIDVGGTLLISQRFKCLFQFLVSPATRLHGLLEQAAGLQRPLKDCVRLRLLNPLGCLSDWAANSIIHKRNKPLFGGGADELETILAQVIPSCLYLNSQKNEVTGHV